MKRPETLICDIVLSLPCPSWNLALLFNSRLDKYKRLLYHPPFPCSWNTLLNGTAFSWSMSLSNGHCVAKPTGYLSEVI